MPQNLHIIHWPDPRLKKVSQPVQQFDPALSALAQRMIELMHLHQGVGLAAPQVGISLRLFVVNPNGQPDQDRVYINPELVLGSEQETSEEGCLSLPEIRCEVARSRQATLRYQDLQGQPRQEEARDFLARIWQHEFDHLNGVLLLDRMGLATRMGYRLKLRDLQATYDRLHPAPPRRPVRKAKPRR
jgi:peptide deformylase